MAGDVAEKCQNVRIVPANLGTAVDLLTSGERLSIARKRYLPEETIGRLRETEVAALEGARVGEVCRRIGVTEVTFC